MLTPLRMQKDDGLWLWSTATLLSPLFRLLKTTSKDTHNTTNCYYLHLCISLRIRNDVALFSTSGHLHFLRTNIIPTPLYLISIPSHPELSLSLYTPIQQ